MHWLLFSVAVVAPVAGAFYVVWITVLQDELKDMKLIRD